MQFDVNELVKQALSDQEATKVAESVPAFIQESAEHGTGYSYFYAALIRVGMKPEAAIALTANYMQLQWNAIIAGICNSKS